MKRTPLRPRRGIGGRPREGVSIVCARDGCDHEFYRAPSSPKKYCSYSCHLAAANQRRVRICRACGESFRAKDLRNGGSKYCSRVCMAEGKRITRTCVVCATTYNSPYGRKTCSAKCRNELIRRGKVGAKNPQAGPLVENRRRWREARESTCRLCGSHATIYLHHVVYAQHVRKYGGDVFDPDNSFSVCFTCHNRHHHGLDSRFRVSQLRPENIAFARALLGDYADDYFIRYYDHDGERMPLLAEGAA